MKKILVVAEQLPDSPSLAFEKALYFAEHGGASIHILSVVYDSAFDHPELITAEESEVLRDKVMSRAQASMNNMLAGRKNVTGEIRWGKSLVGAIEESCENCAYDLIVKTGHRSESLLHQPSDFRLLNLPGTPVMILSAERWRSKPVVMATIDFSSDDAEQMELNDRVLSNAREYADLMNADLHCCYVITYNPVLADLDILNQNEVVARFQDKRYEKLKDYVAGYGITADKLHVQAGKIEKVVPSTASKLKAELVVLGTHRRKGLSRIVLGNSSEKVLKILRTDILAIKPD